MIRMLIYLAIIVVGFCISPLIVGHTGHIYIAVGEYQIETSLVFAVVAIVIFWGCLHLIEKLVVFVFSLLMRSRYFPESLRRRAAKKYTLKGALAIAEEDWVNAEKNMSKGAEKGEIPALNLLSAARAAQHQHNFEARDNYLEAAANLPETSKAVQTVKVRYFMQQGELNKARVELEKLAPNSHSTGSVINLAMELYQHQQDWQSLKLLLPIVEKQKSLTVDEFNKLTEKVNHNLLQQAAKESADALNDCWHSLSRNERNEPKNIAIYALGLTQYDQQPQALKILQKQLKRHLNKDILQALSQVVTASDNQALQQLNNLSDAQENNPDYHYCMAVVHQRFRDFKQAKYYWQQLCQSSPNKNNWMALGKIQEQLGDSLGAIHSYRNALLF